MKAQLAVLVALELILIAVPSLAVPPRPVDASTVTLLPADGTPEALLKMVAEFSKNIAKVNSDAETKRAQLDRQMEEGFDKAIAKAQTSGDINMVLALKTAKNQFDTLTTSDVPIIKNAIEFHAKKTVEIETARIADAMKAGKELYDELETAKKNETVKGNFDVAKAFADYQVKLVAWSQSLRSSVPQPIVTRPNTALHQPNEQPDPPRSPTEPDRTIIGRATTRIIRISGTDTKQGSIVGTLSKGDTVFFRYLKGTWRAMELKSTPLVSPDDENLVHPEYQACIIVQKNRHGMFISKWGRIPPGTAESPFEFSVPDDGVYYLKIADEGWSGDNAGSVQYEAKIFRTGTR